MDNGASSYRRFLDGDESAFREIMEEYHHGLVFFIHGYVQDIHTAEDIAIDVFSDLIVHKHRYNFRIALKSYLYMIGRSRALDHIKHRKCRPMVALSQAESLEDEPSTLEDLVLADERKCKIRTAMAQLPEDMRVSVHLIYFEDMTYEEAAKVMRKNKKQIDNLLYRAKKELRTLLGKEGEALL